MKRATWIFFALVFCAVLGGLTLWVSLPDAAPVLPARTGPPIAAAKHWGYQLQRLDAAMIPAAVDVLVVDGSVAGSGLYARDVAALRKRDGDTPRIVLAYLSIGEAESYRRYWRRAWSATPPAWLGPENPNWKGNFTVRYWDPGWQRLIVDPTRLEATPWQRFVSMVRPTPKPAIDQIVDAGFDGVYLDRVDAYEKPLDVRHTVRSDMVAFVEKIADYARKRRPGFLVVPQNAELLLADPRYRALIDGVAKEDLFYGENGDGVQNPADGLEPMVGYLNRAKSAGLPVFTVEYVQDEATRKRIASEWQRLGYIGVFAERGLKEPPVLPPEVPPRQPPAPPRVFIPLAVPNR